MGSTQKELMSNMGTPGQMASAPPPLPMMDHSFTLQAIMELQKQSGAVEQAIKGLSETLAATNVRLQEMDRRLSDVRDDVRSTNTWVKALAWVGGILFALAQVIGPFIVAHWKAVAVTCVATAHSSPQCIHLSLG